VRSFLSQFLALSRGRATRRNLRVVAIFLAVLLAMVLAYTALFHVLMELEGRHFSWVSGLYWTLTVMSTLGFGDITFQSDAGRVFSIVVLLSGTIFLLVLLPFIFIQFFWTPWMAAQAALRAPRALPEEESGHVLLTHWDVVSAALVDRLDRYGVPYALIVPHLPQALELSDEGLRVMVGEIDDPETWRRARVEAAALVATTCNDFANTNVAFTVRGLDADVPVIATANDEASVDILELAGCVHVLQLAEMLGQALARRTIGADAVSHVIGELGPLMIAEATAARTPLVGKTLRETNLRGMTGVNVVGVWEQGSFAPARPDTRISEQTVLVLAGTRQQLDRYDELFVIYNVSIEPVVIIGGGRVGRATARALAEREIEHRIVEREPSRVRNPQTYVVGNAAELEVLERAGIRETPTVIVTTNDDDVNIYLTIYCRRLRPDVQIITRASLERNVATLQRAGTDFVMSYASLGANTILNLLKRSQILMLAEGLDLFKVPVPRALVGRTIAASEVRERSGVSIVAIVAGEQMVVNPEPDARLPGGAEIVLIGSVEDQDRFLALFSDEEGRRGGGWSRRSARAGRAAQRQSLPRVGQTHEQPSEGARG
jgi:Trk K+ transport system NAD-binding subunit